MSADTLPEVVAVDDPFGVSLRTITRSNLWPVTRLQVNETQREFVAVNGDSIAEAYVEKSFQPFAIYHGDEPVGFTMYGYENPPGRWWVIRLMVDEQHQRKGYGRAAMLLLIELMRKRYGMTQIVTSYVPGNEIAAQLYIGLRFRDTGEMDEGEVLLTLDFEDSDSI